jgi:hypothetical protein
VPWRLIVLGDLLDLMHPPAGVRDPLAALDGVAARHRSALAALGTAATNGIEVDLVPGNHDSELLDTDLQEHLRVLVAEAAGVSGEQLQPTFHVRPWFRLIPGLLYAEHGSQYHALNAVADPLAPFGRWSRRMPPGAVIDLGLAGSEGGGAQASALLRLLPAVLGADARRRSTDAGTITALRASAEETGLSPAALAALRDLREDSPVDLLRNLSAGLLRRTDYVESRQQHAALAVHRILAHVGQAVPVYVFGHTHRLSQCALQADGERLVWLNGGAWTAGSYGFAEVEARADGVLAGLWQWDTAARSAFATSDSILAPSSVVQEDAATTRARKAGNKSADSVATP